MSEIAKEHLDPLAQKKKAWSGRFSEPVADFVLRYTASVDFDKRMALADIAGSIAHATMLNKCGVLHDQDLADIKRGMAQIIEPKFTHIFAKRFGIYQMLFVLPISAIVEK